jgi:aspartyl-tRNA(Asn)/glutamyl-tRNA(Gln) amidotransferase subunit B
MTWEAVIGLEVHAQLLTRSKMFCRCSAAYASALPNTHVCPVCLGLPGALPVINRAAVELTIRTGLATGCEIADFCRFDRKNYFYPDLMKGYQISQYDLPLCRGGRLSFLVGDREHTVGITRVHLEEDTAKHSDRTSASGPYSLIDVNRGGVPLMEIVSEPDMRGADEAREYLRALRSILRWVGASTGSMEAGAFRCDANVSVRPAGSTTFGTKVEVKNMNSFRAVYNALQSEIERQIKANEAGETIVQETRGWVEQRGVTVSQRSKEFAHDYRYFPEPDLPPLRPDRAWIDSIVVAMPELPAARRARYVADHGLSAYDSGLLTAERELADFFDRAVALGAPAKTAANWMSGDLRRLLADTPFAEAKVTPKAFVELLGMLEKGEVNRSQGQQILEVLFREGGSPGEVAASQGFKQISDEGALLAAVDAAIAANPKVVDDYRSGKKQAMGFLVGQVMKATRGQANPGVVNQLLAKRLDETG